MASSTARRTRPPTTSAAVAPRRPSPKSNDAAHGKVRKSRRRDMEVRRKMEALRRLVPSGGVDGSDEVDELLLRAAGYIARLHAQVTVMQLMVDVLEHTED
ncbi:hypothetical protein BAE44_0011980 [Dichanthelium oligosanthes]|uniref:BHLH domain-containing protein n=1 Tax=Dichanthelium oligosanthes TaxID=888268 RepID=A0A1E5VPG3_9POAL|nr:hypothetical protein BAE44_0011980 [Dichanthelium oligosanthes]